VTPNSAIHFLIWLLVAASVIALVASRLKIPYTVALVVGGLALGSLDLPALQAIYQSNRPEWLTPEVVLILFLPPLLFEGSLKVNLRHLARNLFPILLLANVGVLVATVITGYALHWEIGIPLATALLFGAIISATDPISVLAVFKDLSVSKRLSLLVEGESLLNDGTAVVLFQILLAGIVTGNLSVGAGIGEFLQEVLGGALVGFLMGYLASQITKRIDDPQIEITLTMILAYSAYLVASYLHVSGVISTVAAGLTVGNLGTKQGMSARTRLALWAFWEYASFVINSLVFLLIGLQVRIGDLARGWYPTLLAVIAVLLGRALSVYGLAPLSNLFTERIPMRWQHVLVWGGLHGSLSLALALSLNATFPNRSLILALTFGVVAFSLVVQGLTIKPLLRALRVSTRKEEADAYSVARAQQLAVSSARAELDELVRSQVISGPVYDKLRDELDRRLGAVRQTIAELYSADTARAEAEMNTARTRLLAAEKSTIEAAVHDGFITTQAAAKLIDAANQELDKLSNHDQGETEKAESNDSHPTSR
jgi:CPA1 family monovalent cation:H+ antiporter